MEKDYIGTEYPELKDIPLIEAQVILLASAGIEKTTIADGLGIGRTTVYEILKRNKVSEKIKAGMTLQYELTRMSLGEVMVEASALIRQKKGELKGMSLKQLLSCLQQISSVLATMKTTVMEKEKKEIGETIDVFSKIEDYKPNA